MKWRGAFLLAVMMTLGGGIAHAGQIGDSGGFSGGAANGGSGGGSPPSTLQSPVTITPSGGIAQLNFASPWEVLTTSSVFEIYDAVNPFTPLLCNVHSGFDECDLVGMMTLQNVSDQSQVEIDGPSGVAGGFRQTQVPAAAVAGGYWYDAAGDGTLTENVPILTATSASLNHGGTNIGANVCENESATTVTGTTTGMDCTTSPTTDPGTAFTWAAICGSDTVTVRICNVSASGATPTASTYNIRVIK